MVRAAQRAEREALSWIYDKYRRRIYNLNIVLMEIRSRKSKRYLTHRDPRLTGGGDLFPE